jgi:ferritin-like metal-binding protein YciE
METQTAQTTDSKLKEFFIDQLEDLLWAEKKLVKTLPKLQDAATSAELKDAFGNHLTQTQNHVTRLEQVFGLIGEDVDTTKCAAMAGIVDEGEDIIDETEEGTAQRDVGLIFAGQKAEHYEIATYGGMVTLAKTLGYNDAADLLSQTLEEEKEADNLLTQIAENNINYQASTEPKEDKGFFS